MQPRAHQTEARAALKAYRGNRALVVMPCGTGKTLVGLLAAEDRAARVTLVAVPTLALARQTHLNWSRNSPEAPETLIVCSDAAVGDTTAPVTVDPERIAEFLAPGRTPRARLLISTYHSADRIAEAYKLRALQPLDLAILDEAHHTAGIAGKAFAVVLDNDRIPARFRLSLTATAVTHPDTDGTAGLVSMDNESVYGKRVFDLTFGNAIRRKLLADYKVAVVLVSDEDVHQALLRTQPSSGGPTDTTAVATQIAVARAMKEHDLRSVIAFHSRIARSKKFSATLAAVALATCEVRITSLHTDGATSAVRRAEQLEALARPGHGERVVLNNCRTLVEGIDVDRVDGICLVDPKSSTTDIVQAVGRALRLHPDHDRPALILLPVYLAPGENPVAVLAGSSYRHVWRVLSALRDQDERMDAALTAARRRLGSGLDDNTEDRALLPERVTILGGAGVDVRLSDALAVHVLEHSTEDWYYFYGLLERYVAEHGHAVVRPTEEGSPLEGWAARQRAAYTVGRIASARAALLEALPGWSWDLMEAKRERGRAELESFVREHGHAHVPRGYTSPSGYRLDSFVTVSRNRYRAQQSSAEEIAYFEAFNGWMWHVHDAKFELFLTRLDRFIAEHGHGRIPQDYQAEDGVKPSAFGHAVGSKRALYRKGTLPAAQVEELERRPAWVWDGMAALWDGSFEVLAAWAAEHGDLKVPFDQSVNGVGIYRWLLQQRRLIKQGKQPADRRLRLEALPGWTQP
ncbi:Helicase associated domain protein [Streptacidiphilus sp. EB103A]|uniref:DEAD/DEAH box helicase n=1 Tax=Streptacidiphilus sp. EB103A TaxID=3156275 RepID=UPI003512B92C